MDTYNSILANFSNIPETHNRIRFFLSINLICINFAFSQPTVITSDSLSLSAIYNSTNGSNWTDKTNWNTGPVNSWFGVGTTGNRVSSLVLSNNGLFGELPPEVGNLTGLTILDMNTNVLFDRVPESINNLINLTSLDLSKNSLIDLPDLSQLTSLTFLDISENSLYFKDIIPNLGIGGFIYIPQHEFSIGLGGYSFPEAQQVFFSALNSVGFAGNEYNWFKDGLPLVGENAIAISFPAVTSTDVGNYKVTVSNPATPGLAITGTGSISEVFQKLEGLFEYAEAGELTEEGFEVGTISQTDVNYCGQWGDFNNDGFEDIFVSGIAEQERGYMYKNNGDGTFSKLPNSAYFFSTGRNIAWADYNNDGWLDCFAPGGVYSTDSASTASIFKNNGNETFTKVPLNIAASAGVWSDTDNDGDVDLILNPPGLPLRLYRNDGNDVFTQIEAFGGATSIQWILEAIDVDGDFDLDIYATNSPSRNLHRANGNNQFTEDLSSLIITDPLNDARGACWGDIDNDGDLDAYIMSQLENKFYFNDGQGNFTSKSSLEVLGISLRAARGSTFFDFDNDGYLDLLSYSNTFRKWYLFRNNGNSTFTHQTNQNFRTGNGFVACSVADYNNDGFMDISSANFRNDYNGLYRNKGNSNNWIQIRLVGTSSNRDGIGSKIDLYSGGLRQHQQVVTINGFAANNMITSHFGIGGNSVIDSVIVRWPSGIKQKITQPKINEKLFVNESGQALQDITFSPVADKKLEDQPFDIVATASSGLDVTLNTTSNKITLAGNQVTIVKSGRTVISAVQDGDSYYSSTSKDLSFCIEPPKPEVTVSNTDPSLPILTSSYLAGNQWYLNGNAINGETNATLNVNESGVYNVQVKVDDCVSEFSDNQNMVITGFTKIDSTNNGIKIYPNPTLDLLTILFEGTAGKKLVRIYQMDGREKDSANTYGSEMQFDLDGYSKGIYVIKVFTDHSLNVRKIFKQ